MATIDIGKKVWELAGVLRHDGVSYSDYLEQVTFLLFLKMLDENTKLNAVFRRKGVEMPDDCKWDALKGEKGDKLMDHYSAILKKLANQPGMIGDIYRGAQSKISSAVNLYEMVDLINEVNWSSQHEDVKGAIYESLLERIAKDTKSGAGQYFTPRAVVKTIVKCVDPQPEKTVADPCCGSGGFLLATKAYISAKNQLTGKQAEFLKRHTFFGTEIVQSTYRLCLMNLLLNGIGELGDASPIKCEDSLASPPENLYDYVLTNPPFGTNSSKGTSRKDFIVGTSNKQLNFVQHIKSMLKIGGTAAVVVPDNVLFEVGAGEEIRKDLLSTCDLHTILRLPAGIFYSQGVKTNVIFFEKKPPSGSTQCATDGIWIYDYRTNIRHTLKQNPLTDGNLEDFVKCYNPKNRNERQETYNPETNPNGRWRYFGIEEINKRSNTTLDITWIKQDEADSDQPISVMLNIMKKESDSLASAVAALHKLAGNIKNDE